jgi:hypothetical protein
MEKTVTFDKIIMSAGEFSSLASTGRQDYFSVGALTVLALCNYRQSPEICCEMLGILKNPAEPVSVFEKQFLRDCLGGKDYKPFSYFEGSSPDNSYTPAEPCRITLSTNPYSFADDGRVTLWLHSSGADSDRQIKLRQKKSTGEWFLTEQFLLADIRIPSSQDPWA